MNKSVHFLILGSSQGHVFSVIDYFKPDIIYFISSENFKDETEELIKKVEDRGVSTDIFFVDPFSSEIFDVLSKIVSQKLKQLQESYESLDVYMGLTGGTNLMAIASGFIAREFKLKAHYVIKDSNEIIEFNFS